MIRFPILQPRLPLLGLGVFATACIAISGAYSAPLWPLGHTAVGVVRTLGWVLAGSLFFWLLQSVRQGLTLTVKQVILGVAMFAAPFLLVQPVFAGDLYAYVANAKVTVLGNPYVLTPSVLSTDPILTGVAPVWQHVPTAYGPLWSLISRAVAVLSMDSFVQQMVFRLLALAGLFTSTWLLCKHASPARAALVGWNPIVLVDAIADGHHDVFIGLALLLAVLALRKTVRSGFALTAATLLKYVPVIAGPILVASRKPGERWKTSWWYALILLGVGALLFMPFWSGMHTFDGMREQAQLFSLPLFFPQFLVYTWSAALTTATHPEVLARAFGIATFLVGYSAVLWATWHRTLRPAVAVSVALAAYIFLAAPYVQTWYLLWFLPLLGLLDRRHAVRWVGITSLVWAAMLVSAYVLVTLR